MIKIRHVSKIFDVAENEIRAVDCISHTFKEGIMTAVCGKSGSGKSTLLHLIGGLDSVTEGEIYINDVNITTLKEKDLSKFRREHIGFVFQFFNLVPELTASENIHLAREISRIKLDHNYYEKLIYTLGLEERLDHLPDQLSGGQKQRVAIARALITKPSILLLDEPTGNLDTESSEMVYDVLKELRYQFNQTIIVVTHDYELASRADEIIFLKNGKIV